MQNIKNAIITGATQGIGKAIADKLLSEGFSITICARSGKDLEERKDVWQAKYPGRPVNALVADLSKSESVKKFAAECLALNSRIDILVNNAGIFMPGDLATEPEGQLREMMEVNLMSTYDLTRLLLPRMKERKTGHIFNICSTASLKAYPNGGAYSITKYALLGFSDNLRYELTPHKIKVTAISPGPTMSRSWAGVDLPAGRIMEADDVADILWGAYQLSPQANVEHIILKPQSGDL